MASVYRNVVIHPEDRPLLGTQWRGTFSRLGCLQRRFIFTSIEDLVEWILVHNYGLDFLRHYLDDFFTLGPPSFPLCHSYLLTCVRLCERLGLPFHPDKFEGPGTCLTILLIELESGFRLACLLRKETGLLAIRHSFYCVLSLRLGQSTN